jgi:uncharacterized LabA/DUF88 family protein
VADRDTTFAVFIDYDNLSPMQKRGGILDVVTSVLIQTPKDSATTRVKCDVRVYGGWYDTTQITRRAQDVTVELQRDFPTIIHLPVGGQSASIAVSANAELAVALLQEPGHHLFNTYRRKGKPANVRVEEPTVVGCTDEQCLLPLVRKLLKTGRCPKLGCAVMRDLIYRHEQKIVDTMLSCDLIHAASTSYDRVILVSGDDDFLPPLRTILLRGSAAIRFHPKPNCQRASFPHFGASLLEMDL